MKNKILLSLLLFTSVIVHAPARSPAPFQMLIGEWHSTSTTLNGEAIDFKWIFTPGFNENTLEFHSWIKQKEDSDWAPNTQALYVFDSKSNAFYALGINSKGFAQRVVANITGENEIGFKYYEIRPDAPLRMESHWEIFEDRSESQTTVYQNGVATENGKLTFYKN